MVHFGSYQLLLFLDASPSFQNLVRQFIPCNIGGAY
jgi:hypothetical protein